MARLLCYGEDCLTLWAMREKLEMILRTFEDDTAVTDCLVFYRPSFGRSGGKDSSEFGEFDAIIASRKNIYLAESKWDNLNKQRKDKLFLRKEQLLRHEVLTWYLDNWNKRYLGQWHAFVNDHINALREFGKRLPTNQKRKTLLVTNLEFALSRLLNYCRGFSSRNNIKNILLFFYDSRVSTPPTEVNADFALINIDYSKKIEGNFIELECS